MRAVQRVFLAWRRFFFFIGCNPNLHTVILNTALPGWRPAMRRLHLAAGLV
jgi:hypothetical protein